MLEALISLLRCKSEAVTSLGGARFSVGGKLFFLVGPGAPAGLPAQSAITLVGERAGYKIYTLQ